MNTLPTFYISDCYDDNARARYAARIARVIPQAGQIHFISVQSELEAAGNLVDILDGLEGQEALIFLNVAPRGAEKTKWPNGTPFGYLQFKDAHIFTTVDGFPLSLLKKVSDEKLSIQVFDVSTTVPLLVSVKYLQGHIIKSQFRSLDFLPRVAGYVLSGKSVPTTP